MSDYYFKTEGLTVGYNGVPLIKDIEMHLDKGDILTLIGPNGSGKSTILKSITRHLKKLSGEVKIESIRLDKLSHKDLSRKVAVVLTERLKPELMSCWDLVATGRYPYTGQFGILTEKDKEIIRNSLEKVHALDLKHRSFNAISDGQKQRILLARAICQDPDIIILDEPTSFLDVRHKLELLNILKDMAKKDHITVIMSLHEIDLAQKISDKIMCVKGDVIYDYGDPIDIFSHARIHDLYDIEKGSYNVMFGSIELKRPSGIPSLFVIAGGGTGVSHFRELQRKEIPFYAGILHNNDIDYQVAKPLATKVVCAHAFHKMEDSKLEEALLLMKDCTHVLYTGVEFGEMNEKNEILLRTAKQLNIPVITSIREL